MCNSSCGAKPSCSVKSVLTETQMAGLKGNRTAVEWIDSKAKAKVKNQVNVKHDLGGMSRATVGMEVVRNLSSCHYRAEVKDGEPPQKRSRAQHKSPPSNAIKRASQCSRKKSEALKPINKTANPRAAKSRARKPLRLGSDSLTEFAGMLEAETNETTARTPRKIFGEITNIIDLTSPPSNPLSAKLQDPLSPNSCPSPSYSPPSSSSLYSSPSPSPQRYKHCSSSPRAPTKNPSYPPAPTTNPSYPAASMLYPSYPPTPMLYPSYPPAPTMYPSYPPAPTMYPCYPPTPIPYPPYSPAPILYPSQPLALTPHPPVQPHFSPYPAAHNPCTSQPLRSCQSLWHLPTTHIPQNLHHSTPKSSCPPGKSVCIPHHSTPCMTQPWRAHNHQLQAMPTSCEGEQSELDKVFHNYGSTSPLVFKQEVISESYEAAKSQVNLAVQLVRRAYTRRERACSNCSGKMNKRPLSPRRMAAIKEVVYSIYPVSSGQDEKDAWRPYRQAIDSSCRQLNRPAYSTIHI